VTKVQKYLENKFPTMAPNIHEFALYNSSDAWTFEVTSVFLANLWTPGNGMRNSYNTTDERDEKCIKKIAQLTRGRQRAKCQGRLY
jgi:hypothetical protein